MSNATATALSSAPAATVHAVAAAVKADTTSTTHVEGRTTYTVTTTGTNVVEFDGGRVRFQMAVKVTRTTSRSTKTFQAHLSVDNYASYDGVEDSLRIAVLYNENGNAVYAAEFNGYRAAAMAHAVQVTTAALEAQVSDQETTSAQESAVEAAQDQETTSAQESAVEAAQDQETTQEPEAGDRSKLQAVLEDVEALRQGEAGDRTKLQAVLAAVQDQESDQAQETPALADTPVETVLDPETGGRTLDAEVREALRGGPDWSRDRLESRRQGTVPTDAEREAAAAEFRRETASLAEASLAREAGLKDTLAQSMAHLQAAAEARHTHLVEWEAHLQAWGQGEAESHHAGAAQIAHTRYRRAMRAYWTGVAPTSHGDLSSLKQAAEAGDLARVRAAVEFLESEVLG